jgi:hypothetical protein
MVMCEEKKLTPVPLVAKNIRGASPIIAVLWLIGAVITSAYAQDSQLGKRVERKPNLTSDRYEINQTFDGQSFTKDNNIWVYTAEFAETFGMPKSGIDPQLTGIEAAAFRVEDPGYKLCGMGGDIKQCMNQERCMLDVYVDERKHPLPWAYPEQMADWHWRYNSSVFLRMPTEKDGIPMKATARFIPNKVFASASSLHPFVDPSTKKEANFFENSRVDGDGDLTFNFVNVWGYKRQLIAGLTLISLSPGCVSPNESKKQVLYRLESRDGIFSPALKRFLEFTLPATFTQDIKDILKSHSETNMKYFRSLFENKSTTEPK